MKNIDKIGFFKENKEAKRRVLRALEETISSVLHQYDDVVSIILFGSLARKEGVWKREEGRLSIISDLDLLVITRKKRKLSKGLRRIVESIKEREGFEIDIRFICRDKLKGLIKDTHTFDEKEGVTLWGKNVIPEFPKFNKDDIGLKDVIFLFFNRVLLTVLNFPIFNVEEIDAKKWLSHEASKTLFTCADIINICGGRYYPSVFKRVKFAKEACKELKLPDEKIFLRDLEKAVNFRFKETHKPFMSNPFNYWLRSKEHLLRTFHFFCVNRSKGKTTDEETFRARLFFLYHQTYRVRFKNLLHHLFKLLMLGKLPRPPKNISQYPVSCRMASLMLYMALAKEIHQKYLREAERYLSMVRFPRELQEADTRVKWALLRDELKKLHEAAIF